MNLSSLTIKPFLVEMTCLKCGEKLQHTTADREDELLIKILPCDSCMNDNWQQGYDKEEREK
jgi:hypothetical protein